MTFDSYPEGTTTDPATAANARLADLTAVEAARPGLPVIVGEMGYSNEIDVTDAQQESVIQAELAVMAPVTYLYGINYWVGPGTSTSGGYTNIFTGSTGNWSLRPAANDLATFFAQHAGATPAP